jgi:ribonuclease VapC
MVLDASAVLAILLLEAEAPRFAAEIENEPVCRISAATLLEAAIVIESRTGERGAQELDAFVARANLVIEPFTAEQFALARHAFRTYGKGRHRAALNFGDCITYALAKSCRERLLFKGTDFLSTDVNEREEHPP